MNNNLSRRLFEEARKVIPGGVNSPVRSFRGVGGEPPFIMRGRGSRVWDADNNEYVDEARIMRKLEVGLDEVLAAEGLNSVADD